MYAPVTLIGEPGCHIPQRCYVTLCVTKVC